MSAPTTFKREAHKLVDELPDDATWHDLIYRAVLRKDIEIGLSDADAGRVSSVDDVRKEFGIAE